MFTQASGLVAMLGFLWCNVALADQTPSNEQHYAKLVKLEHNAGGELKIEGKLVSQNAGSIRVRGSVMVHPRNGGIPHPLRDPRNHTVEELGKSDEVNIQVNDQTKYVGKARLSDAKPTDRIEVTYSFNKDSHVRTATKIYIMPRK